MRVLIALLLSTSLAMPSSIGVLSGSAAAGGPLAPNAISGLKLWLKADVGTNTVVEGGLVDTWNDQSSSALNLSAAGAARPVYRNGVVNSLPVIRFASSGEALTRASVALSAITGASDGTFVFVMKQVTNNTTTGIFGLTAASNNDLRIHLAYLNTLYFIFGDSASGGQVSGAQPSGWLGNFHVVVCVRSGSTGTIYVDGVSAVTGPYTTSLTTSGTGTLYVGSNSLGPSADGDVAEVAVYNVGLSTSDRQGLETYLGTKYAITITH